MIEAKRATGGHLFTFEITGDVHGNGAVGGVVTNERRFALVRRKGIWRNGLARDRVDRVASHDGALASDGSGESIVLAARGRMWVADVGTIDGNGLTGTK